MNIIEKYRNYCDKKGIHFQIDDKVNPYDETTLFCPAGMQQFKSKFCDKEYQDTIANVQSCLRMNDFDEIGDSTHLLYFNMIGLFSFRKMTVDTAIIFWIEFIQNELGLKIDYVTVHPDKIKDDLWTGYYYRYGIPIKSDEECTWSDGEIGGYCTEFFIQGVEIGNIVNPLGDCIDVGFGLERLELFVNGLQITKVKTLKDTILKLIESGYKPSNLKQGYVLRKLLRQLYYEGESIEHPFFSQEIERQDKIKTKYNRLKDRFQDKPKEWWFDTHGINLDEM
jgi:alanyl-tRNA synthetase